MSIMAGDTSKDKFDESNHPIISMLREMDEILISQISVDNFINFLSITNYIYGGESNDMKSITKFMNRYVDFQVFLNTTAFDIEQSETILRGLAIPDEKKRIFFKSLSHISFFNMVLLKDVKWHILKEEFYQEGFPSLSEFDFPERFNPMRVLRQVEGSQGGLWMFREKFVQTYLAARYQVDKLLEAASATSKSKRKFIGKKLKKSIKQMPLTYNLWLMTFGLASEHNSLRCHFREIVLEFFRIFGSAKSEGNVRTEMSTPVGWTDKVESYGNEMSCPADVNMSCFFVELVYETSNVDNIISLAGNLLENESINYSGFNVPKERILYCLNAIGGFLTFNPTLYGIHVSNMKIQDGNIKIVVEPLIRVIKNDLQVLNMSNNMMGHRGMRTLFRFFVRASDLTHLDMSGCALGDRGISLIVQTFICMPLVYINLSDNAIGDLGSKLLSKNICYVPSLEWLDLSDNKLGGGAVDLASMMTKLPCLRFLNLGGNMVDDEGACALANLIEGSLTVEDVIVSRNFISERGCQALVDKVSRSKSLKNLDIRSNKISNSGVTKLRKAAHSHGTLQISAWEQDPEPKTPEDSTKRHKKEEVEQLLGRLDFQLSIAISKVSGGQLLAKVGDSNTPMIMNDPNAERVASQQANHGVYLSMAPGSSDEDEATEDASDGQESPVEKKTTEDDGQLSKGKFKTKKAKTGIKSASTGRIKFKKLANFRRSLGAFPPRSKSKIEKKSAGCNENDDIRERNHHRDKGFFTSRGLTLFNKPIHDLHNEAELCQ